MCSVFSSFRNKLRISYQAVLNQHFDNQAHQYIYWLTIIAIAAMTIGSLTIELWVSTESYIISTLIFSSVGLWLFTAYLSNNKHISNTYSIPGFKILLALLATGLIFYARINTIGEINDVFKVDASALPNTTYLFTYINLVSYFTVIFLLFIVYAFIKLLSLNTESDNKENADSKENNSQSNTKLLALLVLTAAFAASMLLLNTITPIRKDKKASIYRFAINYDFNDKSFCRQLTNDQQNYFAKLFIGPEQRRVLVARKIDTFTKDGKLNISDLNKYINNLQATVIDCN